MLNNRLGYFNLNPFQRATALLAEVAPPSGLKELNMGIGEPQHAPPVMVRRIVDENAAGWGKYPPIKGTPELRTAAIGWLNRRFGLPEGMVDPERHILPISGTKEALFLIGLTVIPEEKRGKKPVVLIPDPFYQVYVGAGVFAGAEPYFLPAAKETGFLPDFSAVPDEILERTALAFLCSPANPQGSIARLDYLKNLVALARRYDFVAAFDECYTELYYTDEPAPGGLEACAALGGDMSNVLTFHSLSKRSSVPGLRSGFVAGAADLIAGFWKLRLYGGPTPPLPLVAAATALWSDDAHVEENRRLYRRKFDIAERILGNKTGFYRPEGSFYLWLDVGDGEAMTRRLWAEEAIKVLPGGYFAHEYADGRNVGRSYIRIALVQDDLQQVEEGLERMSRVLD